MKLEFPIKVKMELDGIDEILQELQELQTYKLFETDEMLLVSRADVADILARHVRAKTAETGEWVADSTMQVHCSKCFFEVDVKKTPVHVLNHLDFCPSCGIKMRRW